MTLVMSRLTSHSHGATAASSKSFRSKTSCRSGEAKKPKLLMCASPHDGDQDAGVRVAPEVERHQAGGAPVERERAREHPLHPHRHELGHARRVLLAQVGDRVACRRAPLGELGPRDHAAQALAQLSGFGATEVRALLQQVGGIQRHVAIVPHFAAPATALNAGRARPAPMSGPSPPRPDAATRTRRA